MRRKKENMWNQAQRFSIRKFSFGVTSVLLGTVFLANTAMADEVSGISNDSQPKTADTRDGELINPAQPVQPTQPVDQPAENVVQPVQPTQPAVQPELAQPTEKVEKTVEVKKDQLTELVSDLLTLLGNINRDKVSKTSLLEYESVLSKAQEVLQNESATQLEVDAQVRKVRSAISIAKSFPKVKSTTEENIVPKTGNDETLVTPKTETEIKHSLETVKEDLQKYVKKSEVTTNKPNVTAAEEILENISKQLENTTLTSKELTALLEQAKTVRNTLVNEELRATSGSHDLRNNRSMGEGAGFRADGVRVEGPLYDVKEYISEAAGHGSTVEGQRTRTIEKTFMTAKYSTEGNKKFITYDVYFQNDGKALIGGTGNAFWFYPPRDLLYSGGNYVGDTIAEAYYERYQNHVGTGLLSENPGNFTKVDTYNALEQLQRNHGIQDDSTRSQWNDKISFYQLDGGPNNNNKRQEMLKKLENNEDLNRIIRLNNDPNGPYPKLSYSHVLTISGGRNYAFKYHVKLRLRDDATAEQAKTAGTMAVSAKEGKSITAYAAYVYAATGTRLESRPDAQLYPIQGSTHEKTVGDNIPNSGNPVADRYITRKGSGDFPSGMSWSWKNNIAPSTANAGKFTYTAIATYGDQTTSEDANSGSDGKVYFTVKPKKPVITASDVEHKKGLTGQSIRVNVGSGVKAGSIVKLYDGNRVIGTGTTNGETATVTVSGALSGNPITAETIVNNGGEVTSVRSEAVTPTEVPDSVAPTVTINGKALTANADNNRFIIYRGANFNPTFGVRDDKNNVTLTITNLPNGVGNISKNGSKEFNYTIPDNTVADDAPFGESIANVTATDGHNTVTYKFKYRIVDIQAKNSTPENRAVGSELGDPSVHFKVAESDTAANDKYYPDRMQYKWTEIDLINARITYVPNNTKLNELGSITKYTPTAVFPATVNTKRIDNVDYTIYTPAKKVVPKTFNVTDTEAPRVSLKVGNDTILLTTTAENRFVIFRGATFNPTLTVSDNSGTVSYLKVTGLPSGRELIKDTAMASGTNVTIEGDNAVTTNATLGRHEASVLVRDASGFEGTYKFAYTVEDVIPKENPKTVPLGTKLGTDSHDYVKLANSTAPDYTVYPGGMVFKWKKDNVEVTDRETALTVPGRVTGYKAVVKFPAAGFYTINGVKTYVPESIERDITFIVKPTAPTITPQTNGDVTITPANETNVNTLNFTYIHPNGSTQNITATKTGSTWSLTNAPADGVTINGNTGVVTIKDRAIKDNQAVTAKSVTAGSTPADRVDSDITNGTSPAGDTERPKFVFQPDADPNTGEKVVEGGNQIVYVTPTESTDITVGNVTDNSGKLLEVSMSSSNLGLGDNVRFTGAVSRRDNIEIDAPKDITISGTVSKLNGSNRWNNGDVLTRYVNAKDAATNELQGTQENPNGVVFKILTQAAKYTPTVGTQLLNKDVTAQGAKVTPDEFTAIKNSITFTAERGTVKISNAANNRTTGLEITMKDEGAIKHDNAGYYVEATVSYPDGTSEVVRVNVDKSDKEAPKVKLHGVELKENSAENPKFIVFRGAKFDPTFEVTDNANPITSLNATGLPIADFSKTGSMTSGTGVRITENNIVPTDNTVALGEHEGSVTVKDASNNQKTYNFKYIVADVEVKNTPETVALGTKLVDTANSSNGKDAHNYVKAVVASNTNGDDKYYAPTMSFKWSKDGANVETTTTFNRPGVVKYKAVADFYGLGGVYTKTVDGVGNNIKIYAPDKIEREVTFKVQPTAPTVSQWQNGNLKVTPSTEHDKVTIPLKDGSVTLVKKATGWEVETPKDGVIVRNGLVEVSKDLLGTTITAKGTTGTGDSAVDSENAPSYTLLSHTVNKADIIKKPTDTIAATDLSGTTGVTGVTDNNVHKAYENAGITSVGFMNGTPTLTPDSEQNVPVTITYNDGSKENIDVTLKVAPAAPNVTVNEQNGKTGDVTLTIKRHDNSNYPDDSVVTVPGIDGTFKVKDGTITIKNDQLKDTVQTGKVTVTEGTKLPAETSDDKQIPAKLVESAAPNVTKEGQNGKTGEVTYKVTDPEGHDYPKDSTVTINGKAYTVEEGGKVKVPNNDLPTSAITDAPTSAQETGKLPKDGNPVEVPAKLTSSNGEPEAQPETPEYTGSISSNGVDGNGNLIDPPTVDIPEFNSGANGEVPDPVELPKVQLIITKWIDEEGNELKPADVKAQAVLGEANEAYEHGEIEGYVFVRTETKGNVVTHIFRKVTPTKPEDNGDNKPQPTPEAPTDNTERKPEVVTPDEQPAETENTTTKPKASQNILPNTGTAKGLGIFSAAAASILSGLGLLVFGKKEDEEEDETQKNESIQ